MTTGTHRSYCCCRCCWVHFCYEFFWPIFWYVIVASVPIALLRTRYTAECVVVQYSRQTMTASGTTYYLL